MLSYWTSRGNETLRSHPFSEDVIECLHLNVLYIEYLSLLTFN